jgi:DNA-directed RNA polymerase specialized sigma subunit
VAKENTPHKENIMPLLIEENYCPDKEFEVSQTHQLIYSLLDKLPEEQKNVVDLMYGISGDKSYSINKVCNNLGISRTACLKLYDEAIINMKKAVKVQNTTL